MKTPQVYSGKLTKQWNIHHFDGIYQEIFQKKIHGYVSLRKGVIHVSFWTNTFSKVLSQLKEGLRL